MLGLMKKFHDVKIVENEIKKKRNKGRQCDYYESTCLFLEGPYFS